MVSDPCTALEDVIETGCNRLLTSGLDSTALEGLDILQILVEKVSNFFSTRLSSHSEKSCYRS